MCNKCQVGIAIFSGRNKGQKFVSCFFEDRTFCWLCIAIPLKMYSKIGQPKWILVNQMLKLVGKWQRLQNKLTRPYKQLFQIPMANCYI